MIFYEILINSKQGLTSLERYSAIMRKHDSNTTVETELAMFMNNQLDEYKALNSGNVIRVIINDVQETEFKILAAYEKYLQDNSLVIDDYSGFAKKNGVDQSDLDAIDATHSISQEAKSYIQHSFWNYNDKTKEITIYNQDGEEISAFKIFGNKLECHRHCSKNKTYS